MNNKSNQLAVRVSLIYCVVAGTWILLSDKALVALVANPEIIGKISMFKGLAFVAVTALLLYFILRNQLRRWEQQASARIAAEDKVRRLSQAVEQSPASVIITDVNGNIEYVNRKFSEVTGFSFAEAVGKNPRILKSGELSGEAYQTLWSTISKGGTWTGEFHNRKKNGELYWEWASISPVLDAAGKTTHFVAVKEDITGRKQAEEELLWKTAFLEAQVDSSLDGILVVNHQGKKILQNQRLNELWKIPAHVADNKDDDVQVQFVTSKTKNPQQFVDKVVYLYSHPDEVSRDEIELIDGTFLDRYSSPVRDKAGKHYGRIWAFRDITERRTLEAQFRQAQKMEAFGQLAGGVAHDFNNMLAVILMQAELLKTDDNLSPAHLETVREIGAAARRAADLTRQLLIFSRKEMLQLRDMDLNESVNELTKMLRRTLGEDIELQFRFAMQPLFIHADATMMDQVLMNLTVNARDAMPKSGQLIIETSAVDLDEITASQPPHARPGSFVCLSVSDTGSGIPPEILPRIFEPFFTSKEAGKGTGLGLATVYGIVQQHKGWINVQSEVSHGTTFRIYLPRLATMSSQQPGNQSGQPGLSASRGGNETILLVEDEAPVRLSVRISLTRLGYRVLEAVNGVEALKIWRQHHDEIHLLLTDLVMPGGMSGKNLGEQLLEENPKLKVLYTSGYSTDVTAGDLHLEEGANFLAKPFAAQKLTQAVRNCLDKN